jgi:hypothetical protein
VLGRDVAEGVAAGLVMVKVSNMTGAGNGLETVAAGVW